MNLAALALRTGQDPGRANHPAFMTLDGPVGNAAFQRTVFALVADLTQLGVKPGDKILLRMTNSIEFAAALLAAIWVGAIPVLQNSQLGQSELEHIVALSQPTLFLLSDTMRQDGSTAGSRPDVPRMIVTGNGLVSLALITTNTTALSLASRESGANAPQLVVTALGP